tara:strand:+ start:1185 stop:2294 length:1110 start_codon:yes stop_codon:yes gene_type:complete
MNGKPINDTNHEFDLINDEKFIDKLNKINERYNEIAELLKDPHTYKDHKLSEKLNKEKSKIEKPVKQFIEYKNTISKMKESQDIISTETDQAIIAIAQEDVTEQLETKKKLEGSLMDLLVDKDPNDSKDVFLEIRAGTGGDEAAIFCGDLYKMYLRYSEKNSWQIEIINVAESDHGGYKEIIIKIVGNDVYGNLKYESGTHRVQRVPETETQGRIHTSASTVAVLPLIDEIDQININPSDLRIDTYRASGAGGQHVNKTDSAVRITHLPTGTVSECQDGRSQHKNKAQAMSILYSKLLMHEQENQKKETDQERKNLVGTGDRSQRIRTYNFPQGRVTDHRINLTLYKLENIMEGNIEPLLDGLKKSSMD